MCSQALGQGRIDIFVEHIRTALLNLLAQPMDTDKNLVWMIVHDLIRDLILKDHGIQASKPLGYNNTYVISVKSETAEEYGLATLSDMIEKSPELNLGCTVEFIQREDCLPLLESEYGGRVQRRQGPGHQPALHALDSGEVDVDGISAQEVAHQFLVEEELVTE